MLTTVRLYGIIILDNHLVVYAIKKECTNMSENKNNENKQSGFFANILEKLNKGTGKRGVGVCSAFIFAVLAIVVVRLLGIL